MAEDGRSYVGTTKEVTDPARQTRTHGNRIGTQRLGLLFQVHDIEIRLMKDHSKSRGWHTVMCVNFGTEFPIQWMLDRFE